MGKYSKIFHIVVKDLLSQMGFETSHDAGPKVSGLRASSEKKRKKFSHDLFHS